MDVIDISTRDGLKKRLAARLAVEEDIKLRPYRDTNNLWTIGCGHLMSAREIVECKAGVTMGMALSMLDKDIQNSFDHLDQYMPWWKDQTPPRQLVLADLCFNLGIGSLIKFKNTLAFWRKGDYVKAAAGLEASLYDKQVGKRSDRLQQVLISGLDDYYGMTSTKGA